MSSLTHIRSALEPHTIHHHPTNTNPTIAAHEPSASRSLISLSAPLELVVVKVPVLVVVCVTLTFVAVTRVVKLTEDAKFADMRVVRTVLSVVGMTDVFVMVLVVVEVIVVEFSVEDEDEEDEPELPDADEFVPEDEEFPTLKLGEFTTSMLAFVEQMNCRAYPDPEVTLGTVSVYVSHLGTTSLARVKVPFCRPALFTSSISKS